jgi:hypothetical protein
MGRGWDSQLRKDAGTRSRFALMVVWMFMFVSLIFVFADRDCCPWSGKCHGHQASRTGAGLPNHNSPEPAFSLPLLRCERRHRSVMFA